MDLIRNAIKILEYAETELVKDGLMNKDFAGAICRYYFGLAQNAIAEDRELFRCLIRRIHMIDNNFRPPKKSYRFLVNLIGYERLELLLTIKRRVRRYAQKLIAYLFKEEVL